MKVLTVLGTRPEIIRLSRVIPALDRVADHVLMHTGQNSSDNLSDVFFRDLQVRKPDRYLGVDTSTFGRQLATLFEGFEKALDEIQPDKVLILGDTNSSLVAFNCKRRGIPVYHMEAGNRCFDDRVPEEVNRRVIDHCSSVLLPYTQRSAANLVREGIERHRIFVTGNPIWEVLNAYAKQIDASTALKTHKLIAGNYLLATMHRAENIDAAATLSALSEALIGVAKLYDMPLVLSVHPRLARLLGEDSFARTHVRPVPAMSFFDFVHLEKNAALVLTDSGTVQEESTLFHVPVITIRNSTERPETVEAGSNIVASTRSDAIVNAARYLKGLGIKGSWDPPEEYLAKGVSDKIVRILLSSAEWASAWTTRVGH